MIVKNMLLEKREAAPGFILSFDTETELHEKSVVMMGTLYDLHMRTMQQFGKVVAVSFLENCLRVCFDEFVKHLKIAGAAGENLQLLQRYCITMQSRNLKQMCRSICNISDEIYSVLPQGKQWKERADDILSFCKKMNG